LKPGEQSWCSCPPTRPTIEPHRGSVLEDQESILRKLGARTHEALLEAMEEALSKVTPADAVGWFNHCGYEVEVQYL
jgi:hypothetical protein